MRFLSCWGKYSPQRSPRHWISLRIAMDRNSRNTQSRWKNQLPRELAWKRNEEATPHEEQDRAAGGRQRRFVDLGNNGRARASIRLTVRANNRRIRATLRWSDQGKTRERYLGEVSHSTRDENLVEAWRMAREAGHLAEPERDHAPHPTTSSWATSKATRAVMQGNRGRDTKPELLLRSLLHRRGLRYRVNARPIADLRRTADILFPTERVAVFVDGCFWHGCPEHHRPSTRNAGFWQDKIDGNRQRDSETTTILSRNGWTVVRVWEHEDVAEACERVACAVAERRVSAAHRGG
ncbi:very short patch repair endonuclease [Streptomyces sp. NPDC017940]|uniref:very short patch repair endonuclease n=1 Tax=Streptomyces sp. NPDC017940 TaxID=3365017 RepID=UPI0037B1B3CA